MRLLRDPQHVACHAVALIQLIIERSHLRRFFGISTIIFNRFRSRITKKNLPQKFRRLSTTNVVKFLAVHFFCDPRNHNAYDHNHMQNIVDLPNPQHMLQKNFSNFSFALAPHASVADP